MSRFLFPLLRKKYNVKPLHTNILSGKNTQFQQFLSVFFTASFRRQQDPTHLALNYSNSVYEFKPGINIEYTNSNLLILKESIRKLIFINSMSSIFTIFKLTTPE